MLAFAPLKRALLDRADPETVGLFLTLLLTLQHAPAPCCVQDFSTYVKYAFHEF
jgi:hypothetical protein